jgi:hypothetical protein
MAKIEELDIRIGTSVYRIQAATVADSIARFYASTSGTDYEREYNHAIMDEEILIDWLQHKETLVSAGAMCLVRPRRDSEAVDLKDAEIIDIAYSRDVIPA